MKSLNIPIFSDFIFSEFIINCICYSHSSKITFLYYFSFMATCNKHLLPIKETILLRSNTLVRNNTVLNSQLKFTEACPAISMISKGIGNKTEVYKMYNTTLPTNKSGVSSHLDDEE